MMRKINSYLKQIIEISNKIHNKNKILLFMDIVFSTLAYGASPNNYYYFNFVKLNHDQRRSFVTHRDSERMIKKYNKESDRKLFEDKVTFAKYFKDYFNREYLDMKTTGEIDFNEFIEDKSKVIIKPTNSAQGIGIQVLELTGVRKSDLFKIICKINDGNTIVEEWINQHDLINEIYSRSVNPKRIITVFKNNECNILVGGLTIGNLTDISNASCGDMVAPIDLNSGIIKYDAQDLDGNIFSHHPVTNFKIKGFQIPYWKEVLELVSNAAKVIPSVGYIGWDIAITNEGPILIEGNTSPGYKFYQLESHLENGKGNKSIYSEFL